MEINMYSLSPREQVIHGLQSIADNKTLGRIGGIGFKNILTVGGDANPNLMLAVTLTHNIKGDKLSFDRSAYLIFGESEIRLVSNDILRTTLWVESYPIVQKQMNIH
jgi:hypothetical protein